MTESISRFPVVELDELLDDLRERVGAIAERSGFVPNIFRALGHRPAELRAFLDYHDALMERESPLSKAERELVIVATSGASGTTAQHSSGSSSVQVEGSSSTARAAPTGVTPPL